jgi:hypothetical protein
VPTSAQNRNIHNLTVLVCFCQKEESRWSTMKVNTKPDRPVLLERKLPAQPNPAVRLARVHGLMGELEERDR